MPPPIAQGAGVAVDPFRNPVPTGTGIGLTPQERAQFKTVRYRALTSGGNQVQVVVPSGAVAVTVTLLAPEPDTAYGVAAVPNWPTGVWASGRTATTYQLNFSQAAPPGATVDVSIFRDERQAAFVGASVARSGAGAIGVLANLSGQSAAISATTFYTTLAGQGGLYRVVWSAVVTVAATTSSVLGGAGGFQVSYTDGDTNASTTPVADPTAVAVGNTVGTQINGVTVVNAKAATAIQYQFGYTSVGGTAMQYALHIRLDYVG